MGQHIKLATLYFTLPPCPAPTLLPIPQCFNPPSAPAQALRCCTHLGLIQHVSAIVSHAQQVPGVGVAVVLFNKVLQHLVEVWTQAGSKGSVLPWEWLSTQQNPVINNMCCVCSQWLALLDISVHMLFCTCPVRTTPVRPIAQA